MLIKIESIRCPDVTGLMSGCLRNCRPDTPVYAVVKHQDLEGLLTQATLDQSFVGKSAVTLIWTTIPARMEWRYSKTFYKAIALDAGHVCQNLYLACEAIGAGTCAIAAYDQEFADKILGIDGVEEFTIYMASVGKVQ